MQFHELKSKLKFKKPKRIGRGGKRGSYSGRGIKGQKSRSGRRVRPQLRDVLKKLPKKRGYGSYRISKKIAVVNLGDLERHFEKNSAISPSDLFERGLIRKIGGKIPAVKILGKGTLSKPLTLKGFSLSKSAREAVGKAGGAIVS